MNINHRRQIKHVIVQFTTFYKTILQLEPSIHSVQWSKWDLTSFKDCAHL